MLRPLEQAAVEQGLEAAGATGVSIGVDEVFGPGNRAGRAQKLYVAHVFTSPKGDLQSFRVDAFAQVSSWSPRHQHWLLVVREVQFRYAAIVNFGSSRNPLKRDSGGALGIPRHLETRPAGTSPLASLTSTGASTQTRVRFSMVTLTT